MIDIWYKIPHSCCRNSWHSLSQKAAAASTTSKIGHAIDVVMKVGSQRIQIRMTFNEMLVNRTGSNSTMAKRAMLCNLVHQRAIQLGVRYGLMSQVHFEIWSFDDRHDGFLSWIETRTNAFVDVIYSTGKNLQTHVCNESKWVPPPSIFQRSIHIFRFIGNAWSCLICRLRVPACWKVRWYSGKLWPGDRRVDAWFQWVWSVVLSKDLG